MTRGDDRRIERDVDDEIAFHVESSVNELIVRGQPEESARLTAEVEFGDVQAARLIPTGEFRD